MGLPFTAEQFFGVFADYNRAFIVAAVALWVASIAIVAHVARDTSRRSRWRVDGSLPDPEYSAGH